MAGVLIVDDSALMRKVLAKIFKDNTNLEVVGEAKNGLEAYNLYKQHEPDLVTMDMIMPIMDGLGSLRKILNYDPLAKVVMVSAINKKSKVITAIKSGATNFILKPINTRKIINVVKDVFGEESVTMTKAKKNEAASVPLKTEDGAVVIFLDEEQDTYDNLKTWIKNIEDEMHRELLDMWVQKVKAGTMPVEEFNKKIKKLV